MKKLYRILLIVVLLLIITLLAFQFIKTPEYKFVENTSNSFVDYTKVENIITPYTMAKSIIEKDDKTILVDIRNNHEFTNGHLTNARHISKETILDDENYDFFKKLKENGQKAILYGENVEEANIPFIILNQMGIENISISSEGYQFFINNDLNKLANSEIDYSTIEVPKADFAKFITEENKKAEEKIKLEKAIVKKIIPIAKKSVIIKPKPTAPVEEEEEEGC